MKYRALGRHRFTPAEKLWVCENMVRTCDDLEVELPPAIRAWCTRYSVREGVLNAWMSTYAEDGVFTEETCPVDAVGIRAIREAVCRGRQRGETARQYARRLQEVLAEQLGGTRERRL